MTDLMELDGHEDGIASSSGKTSSALSPSVGGNESNASPDSNGAIETDTEDEEESVVAPVALASSEKEKNNGEDDDGLLVSSSASHPEEDSPTGEGNNGFASQESEDETEVADNDTASNMDTGANQRCSVRSPSSSASHHHHQIECDPIDTLKG